MQRSLLLVFLVLSSLRAFSQLQFFGQPEPMSTLNTPDSENYLMIDRSSGDLFFTREKSMTNLGESADRGDIWISIDDLARPLIFEDINFNSPIGFTPDREHFLFNSVKFERGRHYGSVKYSPLDEKSLPERLSVQSLRNRSPIQTGCISIDGKYLLLSIENRSGYGVEDLYVSKFEKGKWTTPQNLGYNINTEFQEISPFLADDNETLIFATNGRSGEGSFDLFMTSRLDDTWRKWSEPKNLGPVVNSSGAETSMVFQSGADFAYFVSTTNSDGYGDIKRIRIKDEIQPQMADTIDVITEEIKLAPMAFQLVNIKTKTPISGTGFYLSNEDTINLDMASGGQLVLQPFKSPRSINIEFKSPNFLSVELTVTAEQLTQENELLLIGLEPLDEGNVITLSHVLFYRGTANFIEGSERELNLVVEMMRENADVRIFLKGHTDNVGDIRKNIQLSRARVQAVEEYLANQGIDAERIDGEGYGGSQPVASNEDEETRKLNRRVEFEVIRN